jgi:hypothetical protein
LENEERSLLAAVEVLELPPGAYEKAKARYVSLGDWLGREESTLAENDPHIFVQGSFGLGTAIRPLLEGEGYDLDLSCKLRKGVSRGSHSQAQLKEMVRLELEGYREAKRIQETLEEKHRCWRLYYQDELSFHLDIVPGVPLDDTRKHQLFVAMESFGIDKVVASDVADLAVYITDDRAPNYRAISDDWLLSNPDGYCKWFESKSSNPLSLVMAMEDLRVDEVPFYARKTHLQRTVQLLKRHRDVMYQDNPDSKPISVIITTLAAQDYVGSATLREALTCCLGTLSAFVESDANVVVNPVNPEENFADRWATPEGKELELKENFHNWVRQAVRDFKQISDLEGARLADHLSDVLEVKIPASQIGAPGGTVAAAAPRSIHIAQAASPWSGRG